MFARNQTTQRRPAIVKLPNEPNPNFGTILPLRSRPVNRLVVAELALQVRVRLLQHIEQAKGAAEEILGCTDSRLSSPVRDTNVGSHRVSRDTGANYSSGARPLASRRPGSALNLCAWTVCPFLTIPWPLENTADSVVLVGE
jgi:hypothetical protein